MLKPTETAPRGAFEDRDPPRARMDQRQEMFVPRVLADALGFRVEDHWKIYLPTVLAEHPSASPSSA